MLGTWSKIFSYGSFSCFPPAKLESLPSIIPLPPFLPTMLLSDITEYQNYCFDSWMMCPSSSSLVCKCPKERHSVLCYHIQILRVAQVVVLRAHVRNEISTQKLQLQRVVNWSDHYEWGAHLNRSLTFKQIPWEPHSSDSFLFNCFCFGSFFSSENF